MWVLDDGVRWGRVLDAAKMVVEKKAAVMKFVRCILDY